MKKLILSLAVLVMATSVVAQDTKEDKAAAKAAAAALKAAKKEAKSQLTEALKIKDALYLRITERNNAADPKAIAASIKDEEIVAECKKGGALIKKALASGHIDERRLGEAYKISADLALPLHNIYLNNAVDKLPFDTLDFYDNLKVLTDGIHNELLNTKVTKGETGNEKYLGNQRTKLASCGDYYVYAAQFEKDCQRYDRALEAYDRAMSFTTMYPEVAADTKMRATPEQIAYYAFYCAHDAGNYAAMDKYYEQALKFEEGAVGTKQMKAQSYLERADTASWVQFVRGLCLENPKENEDYISILLGYYQKQGLDKMGAFADEVLAVAPELVIANYGKGHVFFQQKNYAEAMKYYTKCTEQKPDYFDAWYQAGMCKFQEAMALNSTIGNIKNRQQALATLEKTKKTFGEAIPYFEKARDCKPDDPRKWAYELRECYKVTGQSAKAAEMDKLM